MSGGGCYLQTSTANPYGHRPWATSLYTGFENYAFLKQPQNTIIRGDVNMRPDIYRPPEMKASAGLGDLTIVGGSGKVLGRARGLGMVRPMMILDGPSSEMVRAGVFTYGTPPPPRPPVVMPPPPVILPPSLVPPVPQLVSSSPDGIVYALPGNATTPGSPFAAPPQSQLLPGAVPLDVNSAAAAVAAATPAPTSSFSDWFNSATLVSSIPNGYLAIGGVLAIYLFSKKKR